MSLELRESSETPGEGTRGALKGGKVTQGG